MSANNQYIPFDNEDNGISGFHITASDYGMHLLDKVSTTALADEVYIHFLGVCIDSLQTFIFRSCFEFIVR